MFASATELPYADRAFNTVISNCVIEHIPDNDAVLAEIFRVLQPGGVFATTLPSEHYPEYLLGATTFPRWASPLWRMPMAASSTAFPTTIMSTRPRPGANGWTAAGFEIQEQTYYFSAAAHRRFDLSHYLGVPNLVTKRLFGRWVIFDGQMKLFEHWLRPYYEESLPHSGSVPVCAMP